MDREVAQLEHQLLARLEHQLLARLEQQPVARLLLMHRATVLPQEVLVDFSEAHPQVANTLSRICQYTSLIAV